MIVLSSFLNTIFIIILTYFSAAFKNVSIDTEIYRDSSMNVLAFLYIGPEFNSQLPYGSSQLFVTPVSGGSTLLASWAPSTHVWYTSIYVSKHLYTQNKNLNKICTNKYTQNKKFKN